MILPADIHALRYIARNMCAIDAAEIFATRRNHDSDEIACEALACPHSFVCVLNGVPVSAFGATGCWPGVWSVWMFSTDALNLRVGAEVLRYFRRYIAPEVLAQDAHRVQCDSLKRHHAAHEFIMRFGGRREALMQGYGRDGEDFIRFSWDREALEAQVPKMRQPQDCGTNLLLTEDVHARPVIGH
jgi:hypothetical protein